jgi:hypothetical protein
MAGFSLAFGAMFSKTWRVHSIFTDLKLNKKVIKDYQLFMVVGILLAIDIVSNLCEKKFHFFFSLITNIKNINFFLK